MRRLPADVLLLALAVCTVLAVIASTLLLHHVFLGDVDVAPAAPARFTAG